MTYISSITRYISTSVCSKCDHLEIVISPLYSNILPTGWFEDIDFNLLCDRCGINYLREENIDTYLKRRFRELAVTYLYLTNDS
jgi:hypothetical protein